MAEADKKTNKFMDNMKKIGPALNRWFREMRSELRKVVWPTPKQLLNNTLIVIATIFIVGAFIWIFDYIIGLGVTSLINRLV